jgi:hypothetical protein
MKIMTKKWKDLFFFSFPFCLGLILGLVIFNLSEGLIIWWESIDWHSQSVANVGAWVAGIATSLAALATASAAKSSSKAADAAMQAANQWKEHASYEKYIDVGVKARIKLRWLDAHLKNMCEKKFQVFFESGSNMIVDHRANNVNSFLKCLNSNFVYEDIDSHNRFEKYKAEFKYQSDCINSLYPEIFNLIEETFELSKNHVGISEIDKNEIRKTIEELIGQIRMVGNLYEAIIENVDKDNRGKKIHIDSCLNCTDSSRHYYRSTRSNLNLITGYIENLVIDSDVVSWHTTKRHHVLEEQDIYRLITKT